MKKIALFPGSFDPFTKGHEDVVIRGSSLFDEVIICIGDNSNKTRRFSVQFTVDKINQLFEKNDAISATSYQGLTADYAKQTGANFLLRGLRNTTDFEYENTIAQANRHIFPSLETVFIITSPQYAHISSTIIRELYKYGQDVSEFVPYAL